MHTVTTLASSNPYFHDPERAPCELGRLLLQLPDTFSSCTGQSQDILLKASAIASHADYAQQVLLHGLEVLGRILKIAGADEKYSIDDAALSHLGSLIQHVAVETQFLQETESHMKYVVRHQVTLNAVNQQ